MKKFTWLALCMCLIIGLALVSADTDEQEQEAQENGDQVAAEGADTEAQGEAEEQAAVEGEDTETQGADGEETEQTESIGTLGVLAPNQINIFVAPLSCPPGQRVDHKGKCRPAM